jgi:acyl-CoA dehydrogenase
MNFSLPPDLVAYLARLDAFIETEIKSLEQSDDNIRFYDHRRENARTDWDRDGQPNKAWEDLQWKAKFAADKAGFWRFCVPRRFGGEAGSNLWMAVIREHLTAKGIGLHNDLQNEHSIVGNFPMVVLLNHYGSQAQQDRLIPGMFDGTVRVAFGLTEPNHGSDATYMETCAVPEIRDGTAGWRINGSKMWISAMHVASHCAVFARTSGAAGEARGITCFLVERDNPGLVIERFLWTFNMPTDHSQLNLDNIWVPQDAVIGEIGKGLALAQIFVHENRIRQAAASLGAAVYCIEHSVRYARDRKPFGIPLSDNQAIQWPLVELSTQCEMLRLLIHKTAVDMDETPAREIERTLSDKVSMCNYWANRLACEAADRAIQIHGGLGYSRHLQFEHIYRHHRRYRITEGSEEIQMRKIAAYLFGFAGPRKAIFQGAARL